MSFSCECECPIPNPPNSHKRDILWSFCVFLMSNIILSLYSFATTRSEFDLYTSHTNIGTIFPLLIALFYSSVGILRIVHKARLDWTDGAVRVMLLSFQAVCAASSLMAWKGSKEGFCYLTALLVFGIQMTFIVVVTFSRDWLNGSELWNVVLEGQLASGEDFEKGLVRQEVQGEKMGEIDLKLKFKGGKKKLQAIKRKIIILGEINMALLMLAEEASSAEKYHAKAATKFGIESEVSKENLEKQSEIERKMEKLAEARKEMSLHMILG